MRTQVKAVTIRDVAREADVSVASVSRVLNGVGRVGEATKDRILHTAERLRYVPHEGARSLITRRTATIGMVLPDLHGEFFSEMLRGADVAAKARGLHLLVSTSHGDSEEAAAALRSMRGRVDGLLVMSPYLDQAFFDRNVPESMPALLMNARGGGGRPFLNVADFDGAVTMMRHLAAVGHRRIAHIAGPDGNSDAAERLRGYYDARPHVLDERYVVRGDFTAASGYAAGLTLAALDPRPDAIFAANDMMAAGCMDAMRDAGLAVPRAIAVAGYDDVPIAHFLQPGLTTMRIDVAALGALALGRLALIIDDADGAAGAGETIVPQLVIRESCGHGRRDHQPASHDDALKGRYVE